MSISEHHQQQLRREIGLYLPGIDDESCDEIVQRLGDVLSNPKVRAFVMAYCYMSRPITAKSKSDPNPLMFEGRRHVALFLTKCAARALNLDNYVGPTTEGSKP